MDLNGKGIIITGSAVRLGRAICLELATSGAHLFCHYHSSNQQAKELEKELKDSGVICYFYQADLSRVQNSRKLIREAHQQLGRIDVLINNAAVFYKTPFGKISEDDWDTFFTINLKNPFFLAQEASVYMAEQKVAKILNIGDAGAEHPFPAYLPYSISKSGVVAMTKGLAKALAPNIQVNCINPGPVMMPEDLTKEEKQYAIEQTLLKREGSAGDIARTVRFILEGSDYITGAIIPVDGGRQIR